MTNEEKIKQEKDKLEILEKEIVAGHAWLEERFIEKSKQEYLILLLEHVEPKGYDIDIDKYNALEYDEWMEFAKINPTKHPQLFIRKFLKLLK